MRHIEQGVRHAHGARGVDDTLGFESAIGLSVLQSGALAVAITPSLAYMGEAASNAGVGSFGVSYGIYNMAWAVGLLGGPAVGGFLFERFGFARLTLAWAPVLVLVTWLLGRVQFQRSPPKELS